VTAAFRGAAPGRGASGRRWLGGTGGILVWEGCRLFFCRGFKLGRLLLALLGLGWLAGPVDPRNADEVNRWNERRRRFRSRIRSAVSELLAEEDGGEA
jgi:hypothetical protein